VLNGLLPHQLGERHARVVDPREDLPKSIPGLVEERASSDDVVPGLKDRRVVVWSVFALALKERFGFVLVLPDAPLEVFSCGGVVSAQLCDLRHERAFDVLEPLSGFQRQER